MNSSKISEIAKERADWLLDAVAGATQDRRFLRGDKQYDDVAGEAILMNAEKAILVAARDAGFINLEFDRNGTPHVI